MQVSAQNTAYNQPPHTSFFLGTGYDLPARPQGVVNGNLTVIRGKTGAVIDTAHKYKIKNANSGLYLEVVDAKAENGANVQQGSSQQGWTFEDAGDGYYRIYSEIGDGKTFLLDLDYGKQDNGTNIGIWGDTASDAQLFKFVDNGDGTYAVCTKATNDKSGLGVISASKEVGANVIQWACNGSADQKWILEIKVDPINGKLFKELLVQDTANYLDWKIAESVSVGGAVFGDREFTYISLPDEINGAEAIITACDSKVFSGDLASFKAGADMTAYVLLDKRVEEAGSVPEWLSGYEKTGETAVNSNNVEFDLYAKPFKDGTTVELGSNGMNGSVVNYTVFVTEDKTQSTTGSVDEIIYGDSNCDGKVDMSDAVLIMQPLSNPDAYGLNGSHESAITGQGLKNADCYNTGDEITNNDALAIQKFKLELIGSLPEA